MRKLPVERIDEHSRKDDDIFLRLLKLINADIEKCNSHVVENLIKALFVMKGSPELFCNSAFSETCDVLVDTIIDYIIKRS